MEAAYLHQQINKISMDRPVTYQLTLIRSRFSAIKMTLKHRAKVCTNLKKTMI